eukprot:504486-Pyramimonas_sp.AAC.1
MSEADPNVGLQRTVQFDTDAGHAENAAKRQQWSAAAESNSVEHPGLLCDPSRPEIPIQPRGGWYKLLAAVGVLQSFPGAADVRERLCVAYLRPPWMWAVPFLELPPKIV